MRYPAVSEPQACPALAAANRQSWALHIADLSQFAKSLRQQLLTHSQAAATPPSAPPGHQSLLNMLARAAGHRNFQALIARQAAGAEAALAPCAPPTTTAEAVPPATHGTTLSPAGPTSSLVKRESEAGGATDAADHVSASATPGLLNTEPPKPEVWIDAWADTATDSLPGAETAPTSVPALSPNAAKALTQFDRWGRLSRWPHKFSVQRLTMWVLWTRFEAGRSYREREVNDILKAWTTWGDHVTPRRELVEMGLLGRESNCSAYWKEPQQPGDEVRALLRALRSRRPAPGVVALQR
jgi:hypothetical protein